MQFSYIYHGETHTIDLVRQADGSYTARIAGREVAFHAGQSLPGTWILHIGGKQIIAHSTASAENRYVHLDGGQYTLERATSRRRRHAGGGGSGGLTAEMPGQVLEVRVKAGDSVESGQVLVVLEAMKMEIRIQAPDHGTVSKVLVATGDVVERGQSLIEFQPESD